MARAKSEDRRQAILSAATTLIASEGLGAATASIAKAAGVPSGSVFTYFETKNDLINQLYKELKLELVAVVVSGLPKKDAKKQLHHIWTRWTDWGAARARIEGSCADAGRGGSGAATRRFEKQEFGFRGRHRRGHGDHHHGLYDSRAQTGGALSRSRLRDSMESHQLVVFLFLLNDCLISQ